MTNNRDRSEDRSSPAGPRLARRLLARVIGHPGAEAVIGDIEEGYAAGRSRAWYWSQACGSVLSWWRHSLRTGGLRQDLHLAARKLWLRPGFSAAVILTLAMGIGASTAIFSVVNHVLLSPLPYEAPDRLMVVRTELTQQGTSPPSSPPELDDIARELRSLRSVGGAWYRPAALTDNAAEPEDIDMAFVSSGFLPTLGVDPMLGRLPSAEEDVAGAEPVIVLAEHLWKRRYGADPDIVGTRIEMDDQPHTVVGVMPAGFRLHLPPDVNMPPELDAWVTFGGRYDEYDRTFRTFTVIGRLFPDATLLDLDAELAALAAASRATHSGYAATGYDLHALALDSSVVADVRSLLLLLLGAVGLVLLTVCANVANLYLARAGEVRREIAVRRALGATRGRLLRALAVECALITALGSAAGVILASWAIAALPLLAPSDLPRVNEVELDLRVIVFASLIATVTALGFTFVSALEVRQPRDRSALRGSTRATAGAASSRLRDGLLVAELALSLMLLIGVGLLVRSFANLADVDNGFDTEDVATIKMSLVDTHFFYAEPEKIADFYRQVSERVSELPGVDAAGVTTYLPTLTQSRRPYALETAEGTTELGGATADLRQITPGWMEAIGVRLISGRFFDWRDDLDHPNVVIVDSMFADKAWPDENPIGKRVLVGVFAYDERMNVWAEVVGVVQHLRHDPASEGIEQVFVPHAQSPMRTTVLTIRTGIDPPALAEAVSSLVRELDGDQPIGAVVPLAEYVDATMAGRSFALTLLSMFSALAVVLAVVGTYGVTAYGVSQRTREIGIQIAIGASPADIVRSIVANGAKLTMAGVALGLVGAAGLARFLSGLLYDVAPTDPGTFLMLAAVLAIVAVAACYIPARRAATLDPTRALRAD